MHFSKSGLFVISAFTFCVPTSVRADEMMIPASQDATLFGKSSTSNNDNSGPGMFVGTDGSGAPKRGLIEFNISGNIPAGSIITNASLTLTLGMIAGSGGGSGGDPTARTINLFAMLDGWNGTTNGTTGYPGPGFGGTGSGFKPNAGDSTWNYEYYQSTAWKTAGGDFSSTASSSETIAGAPTTVPTPYTWASSPTMVMNVQSWLDGTTTNNGWLLENTDEQDATDFRAFYTKEGASEQSDPQYAPELTVDYTPAPEPTCGLIFIAAAQMLSRRRRRSSR